MILTSCLILNFTFTALCITIDGAHNGVEWDGATVDQLLNGESNSNVDFGLVKTIIDSKENALYLCFMFIDPSLEPDNTFAGVSLSVENSESFSVTAEDTPCYSDSSDYVFNGAISIDENNGATCEIRIGFKNGLPQEISANVRFIDSEGALSNVYYFTVINKDYSETTELIITEPESEIENYETETSKKQKTTVIKTTKEKTTKEKTTKKAKTTTEKEEKATDYTLKPRTTKAEKKKTEFYIQTSPPYSYVRKTKAPKKTTSAKTTVVQKTKTTKQAPATVYYYEKEIIISHIYVTSEIGTSTSVTLPTTEPLSTFTETAPILPNVSSTVTENNISLSEGTKYKIIVAIFAAISFTALAFASSRSATKKSDNYNKTDSQ